MTKRQLVAAAKKSLAAITDNAAGICREIAEHEHEVRSYVARRYVQVGIQLDEGVELIAGGLTGIEDWRTWATDIVGGSPSTVYRIRQSGHVARLIVAGNGDVSEVSYLALFPLYRYVSSAKTDEERAKGTAEILALWSTLTADGNVPTADEVHTAVEKAEKAGSRGRNAGDSKTAASKRAASKTRKAAKAAAPADVVPDETGSADREACGKVLDRFLGTVSGDPATQQVFLVGMLAGLKLRETYSATTCYAIARDRQKAAKAAQKAAA